LVLAINPEPLKRSFHEVLMQRYPFILTFSEGASRD
jgi:hypothetical protein